MWCLVWCTCRNSLIILDNENLDRIWLQPKQSLLTIATGGIDISMNRKLCQQYIDTFLRNVSLGTGSSAVMWRLDASGAANNESSWTSAASAADGNWSRNASSSSNSTRKVTYLGNGDKATCNVLLVRLKLKEVNSDYVDLEWSTDQHDTHHVHGWVLYWRTAPDNRTFTIYRYSTVFRFSLKSSSSSSSTRVAHVSFNAAFLSTL